MKKKRPAIAAGETERADLLVLGGTVLTLDAADTVIADGAIAIRAGRIAAVGPRRTLERRYRARRKIEARGDLVLPGLVNAHTHVAMTLLRGVHDDSDLMTWLTKYIFPLEARFVSPEFVRCGALLACWEMIASGTTTFADGYFFEEEVARAADAAGLRAFPGQGIFDAATPDAKDASEGLARAERMLARVAGARARDAVALSARRLYGRAGDAPKDTCPRGALRRAGSDAPVRVRRRARDGSGALRHDAGAAFRGSRRPRRPRDGGALRRGGRGGDRPPRSLGRGRRPLRREQHEARLGGRTDRDGCSRPGFRVGLGTDGVASNNDLDLFGEMGSVARLHKVATLDPTAAAARTVLRMATMGSAAALHREGEIGSLEVGKRADLIVVETSGPSAVPLYDPCSYLVYAGRADAVRTVVVEGRVLMERRRLETLDTEKIRREAEKFGRRIAAALPD